MRHSSNLKTRDVRVVMWKPRHCEHIEVHHHHHHHLYNENWILYQDTSALNKTHQPKTVCLSVINYILRRERAQTDY